MNEHCKLCKYDQLLIIFCYLLVAVAPVRRSQSSDYLTSSKFKLNRNSTDDNDNNNHNNESNKSNNYVTTNTDECAPSQIISLS